MAIAVLPAKKGTSQPHTCLGEIKNSMFLFLHTSLARCLLYGVTRATGLRELKPKQLHKRAEGNSTARVLAVEVKLFHRKHLVIRNARRVFPHAPLVLT